MRVLLVSSDPRVRETMGVALRSAERSIGEAFEVLEAPDGKAGVALARRYRPDVVVADEITSHEGAFGLSRDLKGGVPPFGGRIVILLDRPADRWLAAWSGADAWFVKPVDPFELADTVSGFDREAGVPTSASTASETR